MYSIQLIRDNVKKMSHNLVIPLIFIGLMVPLLMVSHAYHSSHIEQLVKRSIQGRVPGSDSWQKELIEKSHIPGSVYTRWGRTTCPPGLSDAVYTGIAGGQHFTHTGGGSNILCLPNEPLWGNFTSAREKAAYIYGSEYQMSTYSSPIFSDANPKILHDHDVQCTVCQTNTPSTIFMLPGRNQCYSGWTLEYSGYLMTSHYAHKGRTEYVCIDKAPEVTSAIAKNQDGALFYPVQAACGSLPCPPYVDGQELTCAVCSKRQRIIRYKLQRLYVG